MSFQRYRVQSLLRRGGMGILYKAWDTKLDRQVALKVVAHPLDPDARHRAVLEAKAVTRVRSDYVVQVFDAGEVEQLGCPYLVMELLNGEDLQAVIARGPVAVPTAVDWIVQACEALAHLNLHGLVHRDVKPANLFLETRLDGSIRLKLLDFGVAKDLMHVSPGAHPTNAGEVIGSLPYMAPEQVLDSRDVDVRTDVWGLGAVLYELLAGQAPFAAKTRLQAMAQITEQAHVPLHRLPVRIPDGLSDVVDRCLEKRREARYPNIGELARALEPYASPVGAALVPRVRAIQEAKLPPVDEPLASSALHEDLRSSLCAPTDSAVDGDTGVDFGSLRERGWFATTVPSLSASRVGAARSTPSWARRAFDRVKRAGFAGPVAVALIISLVTILPGLLSLDKQRFEGPLAYSASHCIATFSAYSAVNMTHQVGNPRGEYWNLYTNGWVAQSHVFSPGEAEVRVSAAGDLAGEDFPHMIVSVDDTVIGEVDVVSEDFTTFGFPYSGPGGLRAVRLHFSNDYLQGGKDRNLIIGDMAIGQCPTGAR